MQAQEKNKETKKEKISKHQIITEISKSINIDVTKENIDNVISIFMEELFKELLCGAKIKIKNFGTFFMHKTIQKIHFDISSGSRILSGSYRDLFFKIHWKFRRFLMDEIDLDKTKANYRKEHRSRLK